MRLAAALVGDLKKIMDEEIADAKTAVTAGITQATDGLKTELRGQIVSAGLGERLSRSWRSDTVPAKSKLVIVENSTTGGFAINVKTSAGAAIVVNNADRKLLYGNGATLLILSEVFSVSAFPYDIGGSVAGVPGAGAILIRFPLPRAVRFPASMANSRGVAAVTASATSVFSIRKNGTEFATMQFAASATTATFTAATATDFAAGDILTIVAPNPADSTLADIGFSLAGLRL